MATSATHIRRLFTPWRWWTTDNQHPFDRRHRVDTGGLFYADRLATGHAHDGHNAGYYATAPSLFHGAIDLWRQTLPAGYTVTDYTLVDIGCGKGRVLMLASPYQFREIVGVELNPNLARTARKNLRKWLRHRAPQKTACHPERSRAQRDAVEGSAVVLGPGTSAQPPLPIRIIEADALSIALPASPVALFYFNSFERPMMEMWLSRLAELSRHRTAPLDLIYIHPEFERLVQQAPGVRVVAVAEIRFSDEDAWADAFGSVPISARCIAGTVYDFQAPSRPRTRPGPPEYPGFIACRSWKYPPFHTISISKCEETAPGRGFTVPADLSPPSKHRLSHFRGSPQTLSSPFFRKFL